MSTPVAFNLDDYEPVASRISKFYAAHPEGRIITELVHYLSDIAVFKAEIWIGDVLVSTGWEEEVRNSSHINKSSHLANAETGAVGRGLANYNLAGSDPSKRPSREEMGKVQRMQGDTQITEPSNLASEKQLNMIRAVCKSMGRTVPSGIQGWNKREASAYIDSLKNGEQAAPQYDTPEEPF
jgi:hypothetical protein